MTKASEIRQRRPPYNRHRLLEILIGHGGLNFYRCSCGVRDRVGQDSAYEAHLAWEMHREQVFG